jgi:acyl-coenzyme A synthetase/AMP-(fatty) acid ligase
MATSLASYRIDEFNGPAKDTMDAPSFRSDQVAAIAFTSGTTGQPRPHPKTWGSLVEVARKTGVSLGLKNSGPITVVATVPPQHMYGLETSIMLPIQHGSAFHAGRPFYPEDIRSVLMAVPGRRLLVTTPIHLRACVAEGTLLPELELILSATAPLSVGLARQCEEVFRTKVMEVYGFAEAGTIAIRRTVAGEIWHVLEGLSIQQKDGGHAVRACYFSDQIPLPDVVLLKNPHEFELRGRCAEFVNVAGHRVALGDLNQKLNEIEGVRDGVFLMPDEVEEQVTRLVAFVVAPGKTVREILVDLRTKVDPVFLPRPLYIVDSLPRNDTGKLLRESLLKLAATNSRQ